MLSRRLALPLTRQAEPFGASLAADLPAGAAGQWCSLSLALPATSWWAKLELRDEARGQIVREVFLGPPHAGRRRTLVHIPQAAERLRLLVFGDPATQPEATLHILPRRLAAAALLWQGWRKLPHALSGSPAGAAGRLRAILGQAPARAGEAPPYATWIALFEPPCPRPSPPWDAIAVVVAGGAAATEASIAAAAAQTPPLPVLVIRQPADWGHITAAWVVLLQAGEILAPYAAAAFAAAAIACPWAMCLTADCDRLTEEGARTDPLFKPGPDPVLLASGLPVRGACALRWPASPPDLPLHAHAARLLLALRQPDAVAHTPRILTHIRPDYRPQAPALRPAAAPDDEPRVTILIPTAARDAHVLRCLRATTRSTAYAQYGIDMIVSGEGRPSIIARASRLPKTRIVAAPPGPFNFARVNNEAFNAVQTPLMLLMNDDVAPIDPGWLHAMVRPMRDPRVGIVGARLLYGNGDVQHEGVIMGLANLCEHAGRLRPASDRGLHGLGLLDRQVSAVTGACLLIRTALYRALSGMDEAYAIALNDVDLCLRAREAGWRVVYAAGAVLYHYESLSLGRHYAGRRAALESVEVQCLRARFPGMIANDPFYSPLASVQPGREWQPAFPPRSHDAVIGTSPLQGPQPANSALPG